jgi:hypothetical protein
MIQINTFEDLGKESLNANQALRIATSRKRFAVMSEQGLHLVNDLNRLIYDKLRSEDVYSIRVYQLK